MSDRPSERPSDRASERGCEGVSYLAAVRESCSCSLPHHTSYIHTYIKRLLTSHRPRLRPPCPPVTSPPSPNRKQVPPSALSPSHSPPPCLLFSDSRCRVFINNNSRTSIVSSISCSLCEFFIYARIGIERVFHNAPVVTVPLILLTVINHVRLSFTLFPSSSCRCCGWRLPCGLSASVRNSVPPRSV